MWKLIGSLVGLAIFYLIVMLIGRARSKIYSKRAERISEKEKKKIEKKWIEYDEQNQKLIEESRKKQMLEVEGRKGADWECPNCHFMNSGKARFCPKCGTGNITLQERG